jgi:predicted RNA-binding protein YlqC (UPF0109 family)
VSDVHDDYVAGDINTIDDADEIDEVDEFDELDQDQDQDLDRERDDRDTTERAATVLAALTFIATSLAEDPSAVSVEVSERHDKVVLSLSVGANDMGRVIGRRGRTAQAIRALVAAAGARDGVTTSVDIVD